jgi:prophage antirepressor-like protein/phage antirepressor YoqD-like protein
MGSQKQAAPNQLQVFQHEEFGKVRSILIDGAPWFIGKEIADILGYSNTRDALSVHVDCDDKNTVVIHDGIRGNPNKTVINESGLYSLILSSKLPQAKSFKRWVTSEVLPSIRKHGAYATDDVLTNMVSTPGFTEALLEALAEENAKNLLLKGQVKGLVSKLCNLEDEVDALAGENLFLVSRSAALEAEKTTLEAKNIKLEKRDDYLSEKISVLVEVTDNLGQALDMYEKEIKVLSPKAQYFEKILSNGDAVQVSIIAKDYGLSATAFNKLLHELGIQFKIGKKGTWVLYQKYAKKGYTKSKTFYMANGDCVVHTYWTQLGRLFLYEALAFVGIYPCNLSDSEACNHQGDCSCCGHLNQPVA